MAGQLLLVNPRKRRSRTKKRVHLTARRRRRNPIASRVRHKVHAMTTRRRHHHRRRRNPISLRGEGISDMLKNALIAGAGSVAVDAIMGQVRPVLPASIQTGYQYAAAKGAITIILGVIGKKVLGRKAVTMAEGALTVQAANLITSFVPSTMTLGGRGGMRGLGFATRGAMMPAYPNRQIRSPAVMHGMGFSLPAANGARNRENIRVR